EAEAGAADDDGVVDPQAVAQGVAHDERAVAVADDGGRDAVAEVEAAHEVDEGVGGLLGRAVVGYVPATVDAAVGRVVAEPGDGGDLVLTCRRRVPQGDGVV